LQLESSRNPLPEESPDEGAKAVTAVAVSIQRLTGEGATSISSVQQLPLTFLAATIQKRLLAQLYSFPHSCQHSAQLLPRIDDRHPPRA
jgi:hypothetical protein